MEGSQWKEILSYKVVKEESFVTLSLKQIVLTLKHHLIQRDISVKEAW